MKIKKNLWLAIIITCISFFGFYYDKINEMKMNNLNDTQFAYYIDDVKVSVAPKESDGKVFDEENSHCTNEATLTWDKKSWSANVSGASTKTSCVLKFKTKYQESILNGTDPIIKDNLIPITIENNGIVKKADESKEWYSYTKKNWANAIILKDENIHYSVNEVIPEENIESYFVWIPKYRYQIWDLGNYDSLTEVDESKAHTIPIIFGDYNTKDSVDGECTTPMESGSSGSCKVGDYMTHPAFLSIPSTGFWIGKFETGSTLTENFNVINADAVQIKPNVVSWRSINVSNAFYTSFNYKRNLDSHMMKNTEWGAVAYLSHSKYGSEASVRLNNNSNYLTGYASVTEPTCGYTGDNQDCNRYGVEESVTKPYNTDIGYLASTTANISGIYDMSGGSWEYVMGVMTSSSGVALSGRNASYHSGFVGPYGEGGSLASGYAWPESRYYDTYAYGTSYSEFTRGILGDATTEMGPFANAKYGTQTRQISSWYADYALFVNTSNPWFARGGNFLNGSESGVFALGADHGSVLERGSFRVVLTP